MNRVLLSGADGYIGRPVREALLAQGFDVHAISRKPKKSNKSITWHGIDLFDDVATAAAVEAIQATHLVHLAWVTQPGSYWQSADNTRWDKASRHLLEKFVEFGGRRTVLTGTCAEYDWTDGHCVEDVTPLRAQSPYTAAKIAFRNAAYSLAEQSDLEVAWARVFFSFGPNEHRQRLVPDIINALLTGDRAACSDGNQVRDFLYVYDLADAFVAVLNSDFCGDINLASGNAMTIKQLATMIAEKMDASERLDFGARERQQGDPDSITASTSRLNNDVGWMTDRSLDAAIDETIAWWRRIAANPATTRSST